jgi:hypothetical protein
VHELYAVQAILTILVTVGAPGQCLTVSGVENPIPLTLGILL